MIEAQKLGLEVVDLYLIHKPYGDYYGSWRAMERLYHEGRIRAIGVSSFWNERLADLITHNEVVPAVNQIETNVFLQQHAAHQFMQEQGVVHEAWSPFAEGNQDVFNLPLLKQLAEKYHRSTAQIMLRYLTQRQIVVIPKTVHAQRLKENFAIFDFTLSEEDLKAINTLDQGKSTIYDEMDPHMAMSIGRHTIHD